MKSIILKFRIITFLLLTLCSFVALAHPGHGPEELVPGSALQLLFDSTGLFILIFSAMALYLYRKDKI